jgi:hypothetical protein
MTQRLIVATLRIFAYARVAVFVPTSFLGQYRWSVLVTFARRNAPAMLVA